MSNRYDNPNYPDYYERPGARLPANPTAAELAAFMEANQRAVARQREMEAYVHSDIREEYRREAERQHVDYAEYVRRRRCREDQERFLLEHGDDEYNMIHAYFQEEARKKAATAAGTYAGTERADFLRAELDHQQAMADTICRKHASQVDYEIKAVPVPFESVKFLPDGEGRFTGYASTFGPPPDLTNDIVDRDAFSDSIRTARARGQRVLYPLLFSHDPALPIGGIVAAHEDGKGLKVEGVIATDVQAGRDAYAVLQKGYINGLSIGYKVGQSDYDRAGTRHLKAINLLEVSLVVFPANPSAGVSSLS